MNKFLSLSFLMMVCLLMPAMGQQNGKVLTSLQFVRANGEIVPDGSVIVVDTPEQTPFGDIILNSGLFVRNNESHAVTAAIEANVSSIGAGVFQCCFPSSCQPYSSPGTYLTPVGSIAAATQFHNLQTEWSLQDLNYAGETTVRLRLVIYNNGGSALQGYGPTVSICFVSPALTGIKSPTTSATLIGIYNLHGQRLAVPQKGLNIFRYSDGSTRKVLK